jgi:transposase
MSTSILYHAFGLRGIEYRATRFEGEHIVFEAEMTTRNIPCPACNNEKVVFKGNKWREFLMPTIGRKRCLLNLLLHRVRCTQCGHLWWPRLSFMVGKHTYVRSFALQVMDLLKIGTIQDVANFMRTGWDIVKNIHKMKLKSRYKSRPLKRVKYLGVDEFAIRKGHSYMTIFVDLKDGRIIHAVEGKSKDDIRPFLKRLKQHARKLKAIAMDMSASYFWAVREILPDVDVVFDRFHVMSLMSKAIDSFRREYQRTMSRAGRKLLKGSRFLLLGNYENLDADKRSRLDELLQLNEPLATMHIMKEQLRLFWDQKDRKSAESFLKNWCFEAMNSSIVQLTKVARTLMLYRTGILSYFDHRITNGPVEGLVNKIKTLKRQAYGYRDMEYFKLRLYHLHCQRYSLAG